MGPGAEPPSSIISIVIPAYNEGRVIARLLESLASEGEMPCEVVVAANGCTDDTVLRAQEFIDRLHLQILNLTTPSKAAALDAAEGLVRAFPRVFIDADVVVPAKSVEQVCRMLRTDPAVLVARPPIRYDTSHADRLVRAYCRARSRTPELMSAMWGAGFIAVSEIGRSRWTQFPSRVADDFFVDSLFAPSEKQVVDTEPVIVTPPTAAAALLRTLRRVYSLGPVPSSQAGAKLSARTLAGVIRANSHSPRMLLDAMVYLAFAVAARLSKLTLRHAARWERDDTSRCGNEASVASHPGET